MTSHVTVVIVNFNGGDHIMKCVKALERQSCSHQILIVDNASIDGSAQRVHDSFPSTRILPLRRNVGFARAVNLASHRIAVPDGVMVTLNPDTSPQPDFLEQLCAPFDNNPTIGATAGTLVFQSDESRIASAGIAMHRNGVALDAGLGERWTEGEPFPVFGASGGAAAYRLKAFRDAGGFPDAFFLYLEDADLAWRLRLRGWKAVSVPRAVASHAYSASSVEGSAFKRRLLARNRLWLLARCLPASVWKRDRARIVGFDTVAMSYAAITTDLAALQGRMQGIRGLPLRLDERRSIQSRVTHSHNMIEPWLLPPVSPVRLMRLRRLTLQLSTSTSD